MVSPTQRRLAALQALGDNAPLSWMEQFGSLNSRPAVELARAREQLRLARDRVNPLGGLFSQAPDAVRDAQVGVINAANRVRRQSQPQNNQAELDALENAAYAEDLLMGNADPRMVAALDVLQQQSQEGPYSESVQNMIAGRSADSAAAAAASQQQALLESVARSGGSMSDASFGAANRSIESNRMLNNNAARRDIAIQAALQNFQGQNQAASQLAGLRSGANAQLAGYYANANVESPTNQSRVRVAPMAAPVSLPNYTAPQVNRPQVSQPQSSAPTGMTPAQREAERQARNQAGYDAYNRRMQAGPPMAGASINGTGGIAPGTGGIAPGTGPLNNAAYNQQVTGGINTGINSNQIMNDIIGGNSSRYRTFPMARA